MENKKNKGLIVLVVILIICVLGLLSYIIIDKTTNKNDSDKTTTTTKEIVAEKTKWEEHNLSCINESAKEECIAYNKGNIKLTYKLEKDYEGFAIDMFINDIMIKNNVDELNLVTGIGVKEIDKNHILIYMGDSPEYPDTLLYNNEGILKTDFTEYAKIEGKGTPYWVTYENKEFKIDISYHTYDFPKYELCRDVKYSSSFKENDIISVEKKVKMFENGELGQEEIISEKKLKDLLYEDYGVYTCEEALKQLAN